MRRQKLVVFFGQGFADIALLFLFGDIDFRLVDRGGGGFFPDAVDVFGFIGDVGDIDVEQRQADFVQFRLDIFLDRFRNRSRSWLISSMRSEATVRRSWPMMISVAIDSIPLWSRSSNRTAALFMISGVMPTAR